MHAAELQAVLNAEPTFLDRLTGDVGAVGRAEILEEDAAAGILEAGVALGNGGVVDDDVVDGRASEIGEAGANRESLDFSPERDAQIGIGRGKANRLGGTVTGIVLGLVPYSRRFAENLHVGDFNRAALRFFSDDEFRLRIHQVDQRDCGVNAGAKTKLGIDDFAIDQINARGRRHIGNVNFSGLSAEAERLNLFGDTEKIPQLDRVPA